MIIAVDFDGTLALGNKSHITLSEPNYALIDRLRRLKSIYNCKIKIVTARGAKKNLTYNEKVARYDVLIREFLDRYHVPYDEISYNKEYAHLYIDDMTITQNSDFEGLLSPFTKNKLIFTDSTVIKNTEKALFEANWYQKSIIDTPKVLFYNDELIITERIKNIEQCNVEDYFNILDKFKLNQIDNWGFETYINNIKEIKYQSDKTKKIINTITPTEPTFFHGDFSVTNILKSDKIYLIDPNYKNIFGSYLTDAGKLFFSLVAFNYDYPTANLLVNKYGVDVLKFAVCEGLRVCKYSNKYISIVNNIADII